MERESLDAETERALLAPLLRDGAAVGLVAEDLSPAHFRSAGHGTIFGALVTIAERGEPVDAEALVRELRQQGVLDELGGTRAVADLADDRPSLRSARDALRARIADERRDDACREIATPTNAAARAPVPPHGHDAERAFLGTLLRDPSLAAAERALDADDFYGEVHRAVFESVLDLARSGQPPDPDRVGHDLAARGLLRFVGGTAALARIAASVPSGSSAEHSATIVREKAHLRALLGTAAAIERDARESADAAAEILDRAERRMIEVVDRTITSEPVPLAACLGEVFDRLAVLRSGNHERGELHSHLVDLDALTGGFRRGELVILASRPDMGRSCLALNIVRAACMIGGRSVSYFAPSMARREVSEGILCAVARVDSLALRGGYFTREEEERLLDASTLLGKQRLWIEDEPSLTVAAISEQVVRLRREHGVELVVIDGIELLRATGGAGEAARDLRALARDLGVAVIALARLDPAGEDRLDHRPRLAELRTAAIEPHADLVLLLHRDEYYEPDAEAAKDRATVIVAKNRNGPTGEIELAFQRQFHRFEDIRT